MALVLGHGHYFLTQGLAYFPIMNLSQQKTMQWCKLSARFFRWKQILYTQRVSFINNFAATTTRRSFQKRVTASREMMNNLIVIISH